VEPSEPSLAGQVYLITGGNSGIGREVAMDLAGRGAHLFLACRSRPRATPVVDELRRSAGQGGPDRIELLDLDLARLASVRSAAATFLARKLPLHGLINNAGLVARGLTADGFELIFGVNHLGHFLLTELLRERLVASAPARVVTVASRAHLRARGIDWEAVRRPTRSRVGMTEYGVSKLANVLFSAELARRLAGTGVTTYSLHPGVIATEIWRRIPWPIRPLMNAFMASPRDGARTVLDCATSPARAAESGLYYQDCRPRAPSPLAQDPRLAAELWERSAAWCGGA
jgi:retinol dehydrogenase-12